MRTSASLTRVTSLLLLTVLPLACYDEPEPTETLGVETSAFSVIPGAEGLRDVPGAWIDLPPEPRPWDTSADALEQAITEADGRATVAFKEPGSERLHSALGSPRGWRAAVSTDAIDAALELLTARDLTLVRYNSLIAGAQVVFGPGVASRLRDDPHIDYIEPGHLRPEPGGGGHPVFQEMPPPQVVPIGVQVVRADQVWSTATGSGVKVGTIDSGYDNDHPDLHSLNSSQCNSASGCLSGGGHGTLVAGVVTALDNSEGVKGVAPGVHKDSFYWCDWGADNTDIANCIDWLAEAAPSGQNVEIINMSFGGGFSQDVANAVVNAYEQEDALLISIANNRNAGETPPADMYPAEHDEVIGVSGILPDSTFAEGNDTWCVQSEEDTTFVDWGDASNYGDYVELTAPFYTKSTYHAPSSRPYDYANVCGTSFAAPHVAGVAALIWQENSSWSNQQVRDHLTLTAYDGNGLGDDPDRFGFGLVDAYTALNPPAPPSDTISVSIQGPDKVPTNAGELCAWSAHVTGASGPVSYRWEWDGELVSTQDFYVSDEGTPGWYWLEVTVQDDNFSDSDGRSIEVVDEQIEC